MKEHYPSKELADAINLPALYTEYNVDEKELHDFFDKYSKVGKFIWNAPFKELKKIHTKLKKNNPIIRYIKLNSKSDYIYLWCGMVSKFNVDDIEYFITYSDNYELRPKKNIIRQRALDKKLNKIPRKNKKYLATNWILSPKTISLLENFLKPKVRKFYGIYHKKNKEFVAVLDGKPKSIKEFVNNYGGDTDYNIKDLKITEVEISKK
jgi:hypothetical protein